MSDLIISTGKRLRPETDVIFTRNHVAEVAKTFVESPQKPKVLATSATGARTVTFEGSTKRA